MVAASTTYGCRYVSVPEAVQATQPTSASARYGGQRGGGGAAARGDGGGSGSVKPWIILHQGNQLIPYINYPFLELDPLRQVVVSSSQVVVV